MDKPIYRMSSSGHCPRALGAERLGYETLPQPKYLDTAAEEGNWHEQRIKGELKEQGYIIKEEQKEFTIENELFDLVGHIDGIAIQQAETDIVRLLEIKSMSQFEFDRWCREKFVGFPQYRAQLACYMKATGLHEALYIVKNRNNGYRFEEVVCGHVALFPDVITKLEAVERNALEGKLIEAEYKPSCLECKRCAYKHYCLNGESIVLANEAEMRELAQQWREGKKLQDKAFAMMEEAKEQFKAQMKKSNVSSWMFEELSIKMIVNKGSTYYDAKTLEENISPEQLAPAKRERKGSEYVRVDDVREV